MIFLQMKMQVKFQKFIFLKKNKIKYLIIIKKGIKMLEGENKFEITEFNYENFISKSIPNGLTNKRIPAEFI